MDITKIDKNFKTEAFSKTDTEWYDVTGCKEGVFGVYYENKEARFRRMPRNVALKVSERIEHLSTHTAGGRICFQTNSPYIALKGSVPYCGFLPNMAPYISYGFSIYDNNRYVGSLAPNCIGTQTNTAVEFPSQIPIPTERTHVPFIGEKTLGDGLKTITVCMPLYNGVDELQVGVQKGSSFKLVNPYAGKPIVFYGSSITQGACAMHAGNDYVQLVSRVLNVDVVNLGFAGSAQGEEAIAEYIAGLDVAAVVLDYDHNAPSVEHLEKTHERFYRIIRETKKNIPIIFMTRPMAGYYKDAKERKAVVYATYEKARTAKENVAFIDGETFFEETDESICTADTCHPNDTGFYFMAKALIPVLKEKLL